MGKIGNYAVTRENLIKNENVAPKKKRKKKKKRDRPHQFSFNYRVLESTSSNVTRGLVRHINISLVVTRRGSSEGRIKRRGRGGGLRLELGWG